MRKQAVLIALLAAALVPGGCAKKNTEGAGQTAAKTEAAADTSGQSGADTQSTGADSQSEADTQSSGANSQSGADTQSPEARSQTGQDTQNTGTGSQTGDNTETGADTQSAGADSQTGTDNTSTASTPTVSAEDAAAALSQGNTLLTQGEYESAAAAFNQAIAGKADLEASYRGLGIAKLAMEDYEGAITAFDQALANAGADALEMEYDISYYKASALVHLDRLNDALDVYNNLAAYKPEVKTYTGRGAVYARMGNLDMARADFDQAISMDSKNYERYMEIYQVLAAAGRADVGQEYLKKALDIDKDKNKNRLEKGKVYYYMEQYDKAKTELEQADSSQNPEVTLFLAKTYEALGDPSYAQNLYRQYLDQDGSDGSIYNLIAVSQMKAGDYEGGLATIQEGLEKASSGKQELYRNEIAAYEYLLNFSEAKAKMETYLAAYPEDSEAAREYTFLKSRSR